MKNVWGLGAAVLSLLLIVLFWTVYVTGRLATTEHLAPSETAEGIEVPVIGTVGDFPEPEHRLVVNVTADGRIVVDGAPLPASSLIEDLRRRADAVRGDLLAGTNPPKYLSDLRVLLRVDGALPWGVAVRFVEACAESNAWRLAFVVRSESDGDEGALRFELPLDKCCEDPSDVAWKEVEVAPGQGGSPAALFAALSNSPASLTGKLGVSLSVDPGLPTRVALELIDAAVRVGAARLELGCAPPGRLQSYASIPDDAARLRRGSAAYSIRFRGESPDDLPAARPFARVARVRGPASIPRLEFRSTRPTIERADEPVVEPMPSPPRNAVPK